jgi:hypothetical protein
MEDLLAAWEAWPRPRAATPEARFEAFVRFHIRYHLERGAAVFISYMELRNLAPENFERVERLRGRYEAILTAILADGRASGGFRLRDPKLATFALVAMLTGVNTWYRPGGRLDVAEIEEIYLDMARGLAGVAPGAAAAARAGVVDMVE